MSSKINLSNDDFIRTTEDRHRISAQALWKMMEKDIYSGTYAGWYSARDEEYVQESDLVDGKTLGGAPVEWIEEESFFFNLSKYQDRLLELYEKNPDFILPVSRRNEVINFVKGGLRDLSISRSKFTWGIPIPNSHGHVMYVWVDALANYLTSLGFPDPEQEKNVSEMMQNCVHVVGKEILRFHAVYWPAFLMSAGLTLPKRIYAHGWWTSEGQKMSKSVGNVVAPDEIIDKYGLDQVRYFLFREVRFGEDGDFSKSAIKNRTVFDLANDLGNLVQRVLVFIQKLDGRFTYDYDFSADEQTLFENSKSLVSRVRPLMERQDLHTSLNTVWELVAESNKFINNMRPWELVNSNPSKLNKILTVLCESIRSIGFGLAPFMPDTSRKIFDFLNVEGRLFEEINNNFNGQKFGEPFPLFPKEG